MQRQKTIAKWLAIILLLTAIIACYIAFSAILNDKGATAPDIAGANGEQKGDEPPKTDDPAPQPVYSVFPRKNETVDGLTVRHIGGESNDVYLGNVYFAGKRRVLFYSASSEYDVKECGIHIATFDRDSLISVNPIAGADETFVAASIVSNGLLIVTKNAAQTKLRLFDSSLNLIGENSCAKYSSYKIFVTGAGVRLYVANENEIRALTIAKSLEVVKSNFFFRLDASQIISVTTTGGNDVIFVQSSQGVGVLTYSASVGFSYKFEALNCSLLQMMPISSSGKPSFVLLLKSNDGVTIASLNEQLAKSAEYLFSGAKSAAATLGENGNIKVLVDNSLNVFCSHLDLQSASSLVFDDVIKTAFAQVYGDLTYRQIDGEKGLFAISCEETHCIVKLDGESVSTLIKITCRNLGFAHEPMENGVQKLSLLCDCTSANDFAYSSFGARDVFYLTLP